MLSAACCAGLEQVHDAVEQSLLKEVALLRDCQDKFRMMLEKVPSYTTLHYVSGSHTKLYHAHFIFTLTTSFTSARYL